MVDWSLSQRLGSKYKDFLGFSFSCVYIVMQDYGKEGKLDVTPLVPIRVTFKLVALKIKV